MARITLEVDWEGDAPDNISPDTWRQDLLIGEVAQQSWKMLARILYLREQAAVSGAMRWSWSQEAKIEARSFVRIA